MIQVDEDGAWPRDSPFDLQLKNRPGAGAQKEKLS